MSDAQPSPPPARSPPPPNDLHSARRSPSTRASPSPRASLPPPNIPLEPPPFASLPLTAQRASPTPQPTLALKHEHEHARPRFLRSPSPTLPRTGLTPSGELAPPPPNSPLGPAAEPPAHSCRPGGPRLYDLLNDLPLEPYGILAWAIVDREEEIYELGDVKDEDKVMLVLWNRWIFLNRYDACPSCGWRTRNTDIRHADSVKFNFHGYRSGIEAFIDENYKMIHRAAGWAALRAFLLVSVIWYKEIALLTDDGVDDDGKPLLEPARNAKGPPTL